MIIRAGLEFYPIGGDPRALSALLVKTGGWLVPNAFRFALAPINAFRFALAPINAL
jgi:hypothetical protein